MTDALVVVLLVAAALVLAFLARSQLSRSGPPIDVRGLADGPAAVIFTQDDCTTCAAALERLAGTGLPVRQVRAEEEMGELTARGVEGVPTTVIIDRDGQSCGQYGGVPPGWRLRRSARRAQEIPGGGARDL